MARSCAVLTLVSSSLLPSMRACTSSATDAKSATHAATSARWRAVLTFVAAELGVKRSSLVCQRPRYTRLCCSGLSPSLPLASPRYALPGPACLVGFLCTTT
eukprot:5718319-Heterocapsa_arctica.AAC.1